MTSRHKDPARLCICASLRRATRTVTQLYDDALRPAGLRATQFQTLLTIDKKGEATVTELTRLMLVDQTTLTRNLAVLERDGLLGAVTKTDARLKSVKLTRAGKQALKAAMPLWIDVQKKVTQIIGPNVWAAMSDELEILATLGNPSSLVTGGHGSHTRMK